MLLGLTCAVLLSACGSSKKTTTKPSYCTAVSNLESSIKSVTSTNLVQEGTNALENAFRKVKSDVQTAVAAAKNDFPTQTSALKSSIDALSATVTQLQSSPTPALIAQATTQAGDVVTAAKNLADATSSKCG
jgi:hypothetical protein